VNRWDWFRWMD